MIANWNLISFVLMGAYCLDIANSENRADEAQKSSKPTFHKGQMVFPTQVEAYREFLNQEKGKEQKILPAKAEKENTDSPSIIPDRSITRGRGSKFHQSLNQAKTGSTAQAAEIVPVNDLERCTLGCDLILHRDQVESFISTLACKKDTGSNSKDSTSSTGSGDSYKNDANLRFWYDKLCDNNKRNTTSFVSELVSRYQDLDNVPEKVEDIEGYSGYFDINTNQKQILQNVVSGASFVLEKKSNPEFYNFLEHGYRNAFDRKNEIQKYSIMKYFFKLRQELTPNLNEIAQALLKETGQLLSLYDLNNLGKTLELSPKSHKLNILEYIKLMDFISLTKKQISNFESMEILKELQSEANLMKVAPEMKEAFIKGYKERTGKRAKLDFDINELTDYIQILNDKNINLGIGSSFMRRLIKVIIEVTGLEDYIILNSINIDE